MDISYIEKKVKEWHTGESSGHDFSHIDRVRKTAEKISSHYIDIDKEIVICAALMHDVADHKLISDEKKENTILMMKYWLEEAGMSSKKCDTVLHICTNISFSSRDKNAPLPIEGQIVQDADRLDAIGAIGIARTFAYGGAKGRYMYGENDHDTISHFYDKLLKIKDLMNTSYGRVLAEERHRYMEEFLDRFYEECGINKD